MNDFPERYWELKNQGLTDEEVADAMFMHPVTLAGHKRKHNIKLAKKDVAKELGVTQEHLEIAKANGIKRKHVLSRVKDHGYTIEDAITKPVVSFKKKKTE